MPGESGDAESKIKCQLKFHPNKIFFLFFLLHASIFEVKVGLFGIRCISKTKTTETKSLCEVFFAGIPKTTISNAPNKFVFLFDFSVSLNLT